jgi:uncharacterized protein HemY
MALSCLINSGEILLESGDYETAEMKFAAPLQIDPNNSTALQLRRRAFNHSPTIVLPYQGQGPVLIQKY